MRLGEEQADGCTRMTTALMWFRRDLRLRDNPALVHAAGHGEVVPLFCLDDRLLGGAGAPRLAFLYRSLRALDDGLGGRLVVRRGAPEAVVPAVVAETGAERVCVAADFGPYGAARDERVEDALRSIDVAFDRVGSPYAVRPGTVRTAAGRPYQVFTPFARAWRAAGWDRPLRAPGPLRLVDGVPSDGVPDDPPVAAVLPPAGEDAARRTARRFVADHLAHYDTARDFPAIDGTSRLSPHLKVGALHPRQLLAQLGESKAHAVFRTELCWREFYADVLHARPDTAWRSYREGMRTMSVDSGADADDRFAAWALGRTGYTLVDAGMRQLLAEAWMPNRVRMVAASFLVKDLHLDWTRGAAHFMAHLVDGDLASNQHNWQWVAGTGTDAAPYFRVFNPVAQAERFDPDGTYVCRWVPELRGVADRHVHQPWDDPAGPPAGYPAPMVDHAVERQEALRRYGALPPATS